MKITAVEVYRQDLPLVTPFQHFASGSVRALEEVYVRLTTDEGVTGLGESRGNSHYLTGDTPDRVVAEILQHLGPRFVGRDPRELHALLAERKTFAEKVAPGKGVDGAARATYLYHIVDNEESMRRDGAQAVVWQTALNPVVALELLAHGVWTGEGVLGPEAFDAVPFLDLLADYGSPHAVSERAPQ